MSRLRSKCLVTIRDIVDQFNTAAIYITHDLAVVAQMADRIMVLRYGELVEEADTDAMMSSPQEDYTKTLWAVRSFKKQATASLRQFQALDRSRSRYGRIRPADRAPRYLFRDSPGADRRRGRGVRQR